MKYYTVGTDSLEFSRIREDWNLKSAFFSVNYHKDFFILKGKGYGHGAGLSQEGAMNMARKGYHFTEILSFYYHNIRIINYCEHNIPLNPAWMTLPEYPRIPVKSGQFVEPLNEIAEPGRDK
jgi:hypothetical protein